MRKFFRRNYITISEIEMRLFWSNEWPYTAPGRNPAQWQIMLFNSCHLGLFND